MKLIISERKGSSVAGGYALIAFRIASISLRLPQYTPSSRVPLALTARNEVRSKSASSFTGLAIVLAKLIVVYRIRTRSCFYGFRTGDRRVTYGNDQIHPASLRQT